MTSLYYRDPSTELHVGDAREVMATLPTASVHCVVTSPPYWGLRDYGTAAWTGGNSSCNHTLGNTPLQRRSPKSIHPTETAKEEPRRCRRCGAACQDLQYGHEPTPEKYVDQLRRTFSEIWRVLAPEGTVWLNLGDSYSSNGDGDVDTPRDNSDEQPYTSASVIAHKSLVGMPWRVAFALQHDGWIIRNAIVWHKPNAMPHSAQERLSCRHEMLFLLTKQQHYFFDLDAIREPYTADRPTRRKTHYGGNKDNTIKRYWAPQTQGKNPGDVWSMPTRPLRQAHCAPFPVDLPLRCIAAGCPEDGRVLDPFSGAGTTGIAAHRLKRFYQGIDLRPDYHDIALRRLATDETGGACNLSSAA